MKEINYKNLIDNKLSKQTNEDNGTAYVAVDGQYEEQSGYGYVQDEWVTLYDGIMPLAEDEDGEPLLWTYGTIFFPENVSPDSVNKIRLIISGENNHDVTSGITYASGSTICFGNQYFATYNTDNNGLPYGVVFSGNQIYMGAHNTFISNGDHVTIMGCVLSVKTIDPSFIPESGVFVKGEVDYSIQAKNDTSVSATGTYAVAEGNSTRATGTNSHAEGYGTLASVYASHAEGNSTVANGEDSHAEGYQTQANSSYSHAEGYKTKASNTSSHAEGQSTLASAKYSHAEGLNTISRGQASHAEGANAIAYGNYSHAEGGSTASTVQLTGSNKTYTISIAGNNYLIGQVIKYNDIIAYITAYSEIDTSSSQITVNTSLGKLNSATCTICPGPTAIGQYSHAEGYGSVATGSYSHAEGNNARADANSSHAEGYNTKASGQYQHVSGKYNVEDLNNTYAEIVGIGTGNTRKNGRTLDWYGNEKLAGSLTLGLGTTDETTITAAQLKRLIALLS